MKSVKSRNFSLTVHKNFPKFPGKQKKLPGINGKENFREIPGHSRAGISGQQHQCRKSLFFSFLNDGAFVRYIDRRRVGDRSYYYLVLLMMLLLKIVSFLQKRGSLMQRGFQKRSKQDISCKLNGGNRSLKKAGFFQSSISIKT